jgi:hypothetical protein
MLIAQANVQSNYQLQVTIAPEFFNREIQYMSKIFDGRKNSELRTQ